MRDITSNGPRNCRWKNPRAEYIKAWALIHIVPRLVGFEDDAPLGTIFNMSVGYDFEGIGSAPMARFLRRMADASEELSEIRGILRSRFPEYADVDMPSRITDNVTLSTMHGSPPAGYRPHRVVPPRGQGTAHDRETESDIAGGGEAVRTFCMTAWVSMTFNSGSRV